MQLGIKGRIALVSGASQGLGRAIALQLVQEGVKVAITSNDSEKLSAVVDEIQQMQGEVLAIVGDARSKSDINNIVAKTINHFGKADILVNNVGGVGRIIPFDELHDEDWLELFQLNVMSGVRFTQAFLPFMKNQKWGRIIFMSSERAIDPLTDMYHYSMTKAAVLSISKSLANYVGQYGITVNSISPGVIPTPAFEEDAKKQGLTREELAMKFCRNVMPPKSLGRPEDVAMMVCYLCSECARWITGSNFRVDGGSIASIQI